MKKGNKKVNSSNVLDMISKGNENVENIRKQLFTVYDIQVPAPEKYLKKVMTDSSYDIEHINSLEVEMPDTKIIYNSEGNFLGAAGRTYESIQPETFLDSLVDTVSGCETSLDLSNLTYKAIKGGRVVEFRLFSEMYSFKNSRGHEDSLKMYFSFLTGFGGKMKTLLQLFSERLTCDNGMRITQTEMQLALKHTAKMNAKAELYCEQLMKVMSQVKEVGETWEQMDKVQVNSKLTKLFAEKIAGVTEQEKKEGKISTKKQNILASVNTAIEEEFARTGTTVWGLLNGATNYTNHYANGSDNEDYILVGTGANLNKLAQREAIALLN